MEGPTYKGGPICFGFLYVNINMIKNENGELIRDPNQEHRVTCCCADEDTENSITAPIQQQPQSNPLPSINQVTPQDQTPAAPFVQATPQAIPNFASPAYAPQQIEIPMAQMQDWSAQQSYGGYNDGPVKKSRALCIIL